MNPDLAPEEYANILSLPKNKEALDYIKQRLIEHGSPERFEVIDELFEMHRTSTGFNPLSLSKGRFKRIKATAIRQILKDINRELPFITNTSEYKEYLQKQNRSVQIFEKLTLIKSKLENNDYKGIEKEILELKEQITVSDPKDLLVALSSILNPVPRDKKYFG